MADSSAQPAAEPPIEPQEEPNALDEIDEEEEQAEREAASDDDPDDPVVAEYDVFITPDSEHELYVLQFVGRDRHEAFTEFDRPSELRIKPRTGYIEVDIPININKNYDKMKGVRYGEAQRRTKGFGQTSYGPSAGFEHAMPRSTKRPGTVDPDADPDEAAPPSHMVDDESVDKYVRDFRDANEKGHVFNKVTWSGRIYPQESWKPKYMIGTFRGKELHLTKLDGIIQLRPELHHVDALSHLDVASRRREATDARAVLPTVKKAEEEGSIASQLKAAAEESWEKMNWVHSEEGSAYETFNKRLFLEDTENAPVIEWEAVPDYVERVLPVRVGVKSSKADSIKVES